MTIWKFKVIYFRIDTALEEYFRFRYDFERMGKKNRFASILSIAIRLYFLNNFIITVKTADISTYSLNAENLE